jgi:hypothetical protein
MFISAAVYLYFKNVLAFWISLQLLKFHHCSALNWNNMANSYLGEVLKGTEGGGALGCRWTRLGFTKSMKIQRELYCLKIKKALCFFPLGGTHGGNPSCNWICVHLYSPNSSSQF